MKEMSSFAVSSRAPEVWVTPELITHGRLEDLTNGQQGPFPDLSAAGSNLG